MDLAEIIKDLGYVRDDGETLVPQPHLDLDPKKMWKLENVQGIHAAEPQHPAQRDVARGARGARRRVQGGRARRPPAAQEASLARSQLIEMATGPRGRPPLRRLTGQHLMGETYQVRLEPVGIEFEVDEDETVLRGAFRQGLMLMHGCKEGQCSACKSFLLDGEVDLDKYSTFALNDFEKEEGWTLLCRAHADVRPRGRTHQLRRGGAAQRGRAADPAMRVEAIEALTHDIRRLVLSGAASGSTFNPGQYVDIKIPGDSERGALVLDGEPARAASSSS